MKYEHIPLSPEFENSISEGQESNHVISMSDNKSVTNDIRMEIEGRVYVRLYENESITK